jgi:predicted ATPase
LSLKILKVKNFKSLHNFRLELGKFNVLIGKNASGKTNVVEVFRLLKEIVKPETINPPIKFGGYKNIVWKGDEELPIEIFIDTTDNVQYFISFIVQGGRFQILKEEFTSKKIQIKREGEKVQVVRGKKRVKTKRYPLSRSILSLPVWLEEGILVAMPIVELWSFIQRISVSHFIPTKMKGSSSPEIAELDFCGENIHTILQRIFQENQTWPREMLDPLQTIFPEIENIKIVLTEDGRFILKVSEKGLDLPPKCISDGFYKILGILALTKYPTSLIVVEEIENSIHPEAIEVVVGALRESKKQVILTTHSPTVLDLIPPSETITISKTYGETKAGRVKNPKALKEKLDAGKMTHGEAWLHGLYK